MNPQDLLFRTPAWLHGSTALLQHVQPRLAPPLAPDVTVRLAEHVAAVGAIEPAVALVEAHKW
jgi:hypothetical protein